MTWALWMLWGFGYETVWKRYSTEVEGVVISSQNVPQEGGPRYVTEYIVRSADGRDFRYVAGPTDASLQRGLQPGTRIRKLWGRLDYEVNGNPMSFPVPFYSAIVGLALFCLLWAAAQWRWDMKK